VLLQLEPHLVGETVLVAELIDVFQARADHPALITGLLNTSDDVTKSRLTQKHTDDLHDPFRRRIRRDVTITDGGHGGEGPIKLGGILFFLALFLEITSVPPTHIVDVIGVAIKLALSTGIREFLVHPHEIPQALQQVLHEDELHHKRAGLHYPLVYTIVLKHLEKLRDLEHPSEF